MTDILFERQVNPDKRGTVCAGPKELLAAALLGLHFFFLLFSVIVKRRVSLLLSRVSERKLMAVFLCFKRYYFGAVENMSLIPTLRMFLTANVLLIGNGDIQGGGK
ncbi:hypothetical protein CEXT_238091 [Caerostris extrusa]|uniref:Uncharacterized protein n=1 Tax=Caerostris extrusa TaxID=172846 RepID=A0AAV4QLE8_CAEEX|nr:hypothetical protein CEXT_238091 [Caerostris extrusa]